MKQALSLSTRSLFILLLACPVMAGEHLAPHNKGMTRDPLSAVHTNTRVDHAAGILFYHGFNLNTGESACDPTVLALAPGTIAETDAILPLPLTDPFDFGPGAAFHFEFQTTAPIVFVPESGITAVLLHEPYDSVDESDIAGLSAWTAGQPVSSNDTVIVLTTSGTYDKIGNFQEQPDDWTVEFTYATVGSASYLLWTQ